MVKLDEVGEFVHDDVIDERFGFLDQLEVERDHTFFGAAPPA